MRSIITVGDGIWATCGSNIYIIAADSLDEYKIQVMGCIGHTFDKKLLVKY